jgi:hypothetical protein
MIRAIGNQKSPGRRAFLNPEQQRCREIFCERFGKMIETRFCCTA